MWHTTLVSSLFLLLAQHAIAGCYYPDGTEDNNVEYQPCSQDSSNPLSTICCATNRKDGADICAPNGLCQVGRKKGSPPADPQWTKPSCTNMDYNENGCLHVCGDAHYPFLTPCNSGAGNASTKWCCGNSQDCCDGGSGLGIQFLPVEFNPKNFTGGSSSSSTSSKPTSSATQSRSSSWSTAASQTSIAFTPGPTLPANTTGQASEGPPSTGLSTGAKAGIGLGVTFGALSLIALGYILYKRSQRPPHDNNPYPPEYVLPPEKDAAVYAHYDHSQGSLVFEKRRREQDIGPPTPMKDNVVRQIHEMPAWEGGARGGGVIAELDGRKEAKELFAGEGKV